MDETELGRWVEPETAFLALAGDAADVVWLDSGIHAESGMSLIGWLMPDGPRLRVERAEDAATVLAALARPRKPGAGLFPLWAGWFSHEFGSALLGLPCASSGVLAELALLERGVIFDHAARTVRIVAARSDRSWAATVLASLRRVPDKASDPPEPATPRSNVTRRRDDATYLAAIRACLAHIAAGDAYQLCLTEQWSVPRPTDSLAVYRRLRRLAPTHHGGLIRFGQFELLSASPERFVEVGSDGLVTTRPMKGTRRRDRNDAIDAALAAELRASEKEQAENLMIVDLVRNDLSRVCELGTVSVDSLFAVEHYRTVHQLVSTVSGRLAPGCGAADAIAALFPAGSMTGAPKRRAVQLLQELEGRRRGPYAGAFGYVAADGSADFATTIRTIVLDGDTAVFGTGGGITASSDPQAELDEMKLKARALIDAI